MNEEGQAAPDAATAWFVRLRDDTITETERAEFEAWRHADPAHAAAFGELERVWSGLDQISPHARSPERCQGRASPRPSEATGRAIGRRRVIQRLAIAASVTAVVGLGSYALAPVGLMAEHRTAAGEQRVIELEDGSSIHLNTATAVTTRFDAASRRITLHGGEAYFTVKADPGRPFVVDAGMGRVTVLGTAFSIHRTGDSVEVLVTENRVEVAGPAGQTAVVPAGKQVQLTGAGLGEVTPADAGKALSWRRGRLVFENRPLGDVLEELQRYRRGRIVVMDPAVKTLPVTGSFKIDRAEETLDTIERTLPVRLRRVTDLVVLVFPQ